ncbi:hypothetical protein [Methylobacterium planeticum]|uniref:Uncharacterized protein n=1 Tax=Methylobacterium planeticum TaxID=2615211 RepID=A0A6N6MLT7_9HYPH|nr:hypothetical protein [Methylobacterium planeticum]KAB1070156.1 hypothetical protein F6X51_23590 [Methylobacterium planeticum]
MIASFAIDRLRRGVARRPASGSVRPGRAGILAGLLALLILVLVGLPDDRFAELMPRRAEAGITNVAVATSATLSLLGGRHAALLASVDADDPPADDRRLAPDPPRCHRLPALSGFPPSADGAVPSASVRLLERPPKRIG